MKNNVISLVLGQISDKFIIKKNNLKNVYRWLSIMFLCRSEREIIRASPPVLSKAAINHDLWRLFDLCPVGGGQGLVNFSLFSVILWWFCKIGQFFGIAALLRIYNVTFCSFFIEGFLLVKHFCVFLRKLLEEKVRKTKQTNTYFI